MKRFTITILLLALPMGAWANTLPASVKILECTGNKVIQLACCCITLNLCIPAISIVPREPITKISVISG
jgi:hypothetical protein|tara:strand:- start:691 stop:900 length:210 start_codon:yes stop_codon:yes gene_type:complete